MVTQPILFETEQKDADIEKAVLYALGDFQSRKKVLAERQLPLDRLRGAFKRAAEKFQMAEFDDESLALTLTNLGAAVVRVPNFVAKHPFRVTVSKETAERALELYGRNSKND